VQLVLQELRALRAQQDQQELELKYLEPLLLYLYYNHLTQQETLEMATWFKETYTFGIM
jgi:hypothetical protein